MHIITFKRLSTFWDVHPDAEQPLRAWFHHARRAVWRRPADVKRDFAGASIITGNRVVFNIKGNTYRLVVKIEYRLGRIYIRFVGSHGEYDRVDVTTI
jgi:mRNA interferase HigB